MFARAFTGAMTPLRTLSYQYKYALAVLNTALVVAAIVAYAYHNTVCTPYVYSFFALFEWLFVLTNVFFHMGGHLDIADGYANWTLIIAPVCIT